ncbi:hypothetical protein ACFQ07_17945, partial [Actinomadura adrarensis]
LPCAWPGAGMTAPPILVARHLVSTLAVRGVQAVPRHGRGISLVSVPLGSGSEMNVWVEPRHLSCVVDGARVRRPIADLYDTVEELVRCREQRSPA